MTNNAVNAETMATMLENMAALLRGGPVVALPVATPVAPKATPVVTPVENGLKGNTTGACHFEGCTKTGLLTNMYCGQHRRALAKRADGLGLPIPAGLQIPTVQEAKQHLVDLGTYDVPAKVSNKGRRDAKAHCAKDACGLFVAKGERLCKKHNLEAFMGEGAKPSPVSPETHFITLDNGKRGYRVPADMVIALRKVHLTDEQIIKAAKDAGVGRKVAKDTSTI